MAQAVRELITLQVGHYANFVGTHFWNLQEASFVYDSSSVTDINHDFLFREGLTPQRQETYTPRLLCIDVKGSLCSLPSRGSLYNPIQPEPSISEAAWDGPVDLIQQLPEEKNEYLMDLEQEDARFLGGTDEDKDICIDDSSVFSKGPENHLALSQKIYDLSKSVSVWSDFLRPHLHPNSIYLLDDTSVKIGRPSGNNDEKIWGFPSGSALFCKEEVEDEITDRIRLIAESCNNLQGFQVLSDVHDGMGGVSFGILQHLADEYGSKDSITFATTPSHLSSLTPQARILMKASIIQSYTELSKLSSVFVPLNLRQHCWDFQAPYVTFPCLTVMENNAYITSSVMAAFVDTAGLVCRSRTSPMSLSCVVDLLTPARRNIVGGSLALPLGLSCDQGILEWLQQGNKTHLVSMSGGCNFTLDPISEIRIIRGVPSSRLLRPDTKLPPGLHYENASQIYRDYLQESQIPPSVRKVAGVEDPIKITPPFPSIFSEVLTEDGFVNTSGIVAPSRIMKSAPCEAGLHQSGGMGHLLHDLQTAAQNLNVAKVPSLLDEGFDKDGWSALVEDLRTITLNYCLDNIDSDNSDD
nr:protein misato homolog 1-like [Procambarus clarkii]XP_045594409.1 protein misato homolog 1-like [Procambarus clarkii]XP_045594410.1 protein misato homolog 1-like [Procambarus clarkii]